MSGTGQFWHQYGRGAHPAIGRRSVGLREEGRRVSRFTMDGTPSVSWIRPARAVCCGYRAGVAVGPTARSTSPIVSLGRPRLSFDADRLVLATAAVDVARLRTQGRWRHDARSPPAVSRWAWIAAGCP
jgi:hypothetical protein